MNAKVSRSMIRKCRAITGVDKIRCPVVVVKGWKPPRLVGESGYWATPNGERIAYPATFYARKWVKVYIRSTLKIEAGRQWIDCQR